MPRKRAIAGKEAIYPFASAGNRTRPRAILARDAARTTLREGRTSVSLMPPAEGGLQLLLEGDADGDGVYESLIGDAVPPGAALRVRALGWPGAGAVQVRANDRMFMDGVLLAPSGEVRLRAPAEPGWVRATLLVADASAERTARCDPVVGGLTNYCCNSLSIAALTSPIYVRPRDGL